MPPMIRNTVGFHYGRKVVLQSLARIKERWISSGPRKSDRTIELASLSGTRRSMPGESAENNIAVPGILKIPKSSTCGRPKTSSLPCP